MLKRISAAILSTTLSLSAMAANGVESNIVNSNDDGSGKHALALSGAGVAGIAYAGALNAYENHHKHSIKDTVDIVAGTSAGSIAAGLVAMDYSVDEITALLSDLDFTDFVDTPKTYVGMAYNVLNSYGVNNGEFLHQFLRKVVEEKMGNPDATLLDVKNKTGKSIYIFVTNVGSNAYEVLSSDDPRTRDIPIAKAMHTSSDIPFFWRADFYTERYNKLIPVDDFSKYPATDVTAFVDGGVIINYPITYLQQHFPKADTLGFLMTDENTKEWFTTGKQPIAETNVLTQNDIFSYVPALFSAMFRGQYAQFVENEKVLSNSALIDTKGISAIKFTLSDEEKNALLRSGCETVSDYYGESSNICNKYMHDIAYKTELTGMSGFYNDAIKSAEKYVQSDAYQEKLKKEEQYFSQLNQK